MTVIARALLCSLAAVVGVAIISLFTAGSGSGAGRSHRAVSDTRVGTDDRRGVVLVVAVSLLQSALIAAIILQWRRSHRIEASLAESEERVALATLPINLGLWRWNARNDEFWATEHLREILHVPDDLPLDRHSMLLSIHPEDRRRFAEAFTRPGNGEVLDADFRVMCPNGEVRWVTGKARARRDSLGHILRVTGMVMDITDRKQAEAECQNQRLQLAHLTRVAIMGQLSGALAHELTQPLTAILSNAQAAQRFLANDRANLTEVREILEDIVTDDKRAGDVIRRVRALLKRGETQLQQLDVQQLVREALAVARSDLIVRRVDVACQIADDLPPVWGDRVQIQQVLLNLLLNGAEAMAENDPHRRRIEISAFRDDHDVQISVADCGTGIARDQLERVFDAFFTTKSNGMGLGLAICRSIVVAHGGRLWATSDGTRGSAFHFTLPALAAQQANDRCTG